LSIEKSGSKVVSVDKTYFNPLTRSAKNSIQFFEVPFVRGLELSEGSLKRDPSIGTTFSPPLYSLDDVLQRYDVS
jgi:hypothetical protein